MDLSMDYICMDKPWMANHGWECQYRNNTRMEKENVQWLVGWFSLLVATATRAFLKPTRAILLEKHCFLVEFRIYKYACLIKLSPPEDGAVVALMRRDIWAWIGVAIRLL